jgi:hypothetical protein
MPAVLECCRAMCLHSQFLCCDKSIPTIEEFLDCRHTGACRLQGTGCVASTARSSSMQLLCCHLMHCKGGRWNPKAAWRQVRFGLQGPLTLTTLNSASLMWLSAHRNTKQGLREQLLLLATRPLAL